MSANLNELIKEVRCHEVAIAELNHLSSSKVVYQRNGNIFFRTSVQKAIASEKKQLDAANGRLGKTSSS